MGLIMQLTVFAGCFDYFQPGASLVSKVTETFMSSLECLIIVIAAAIPWIILLLFLSWLSLKFLKWWVRKKREAKSKRPAGDNAQGL